MTSSRGAMRYRATIERGTRTPDAGGGRTVTWAVVASSVPCWAWLKSSAAFSAIVQEGAKPTLVDARHITVPLGTDVRVGDRVTIRDRRETSVIFPAMILDAVGPRADHLHLLARSIT